MSPIRVMHLASGDLWAGAEVQIFTLCHELSKLDNTQVKVITFNSGELAERLTDHGIEVVILSEKQNNFLKLLFLVLRECLSFKANLIHSHGYKQNIIASLCSLFVLTPSIRTIHGAAEFNSKRFSVKDLISKLDVFTGKHLQKKVVVVSNDLKEQLVSKFGERQVEVIVNGIDLSEPDPPRPNQKNNTLNIGIVGRLTPVKRVDLFIEMAHILRKKKSNTHLRFHIIGDGELMPSLKGLAIEKGVEDYLSFTGHVNNALERIDALDLLIMCSDHEGTPMTILEAFLCETPVVAHAVGGLKELLDNGQCGALVEAHRAEAYASAVEDALANPSLTTSKAKLGRKRLEEKYSAKTNASSYKFLYQKTKK